jgi:hypothetical protein
MRFLKLFPLIIDLAKIAELAVPLSGQGKAKLAFALDAAEAVYNTEEELRNSWKDKAKFLEAVTRAIQVSVALLNTAGVFQKTAPAQ